jgi:heptosyltransferase III
MDEFKSILVIATRQIGDVLLTSPLIDAAHRRWPQAAIDILGFRGTLGMLQGHAAIRERIEVQPGATLRSSWGLLRRLWRRYDLALVTQQSDRAHFYALWAARVRSGLVPGRLSIAWWKQLSLHHAVTIDDEVTPTVIEKLRLLAPWQALPAAVNVTAPPEEALQAALQQALRPPFVVVHVPSMWSYKQWPLSSFAQVIAGLLAHGVQVVLSGSASPADQAQVAQMRSLGGPPHLLDASGQLSLRQVAALLRQAALYVGPDTSITHLAAACDIPVVTVFGPTNPVRWGPWPQGAASPGYRRAAPRQTTGRIILLQADQPCIACGRAGCDDHQHSRSACLEALEPQRVLDECLGALRLTETTAPVS